MANFWMRAARISSALLIFACLLGRAQTVSSQPVLQGIVRDPSGAVLSGVSIHLEDVSSKRAETLTNAQGQYFLQPLPAGAYILHASKSGFLPAEKSVSLKSGVAQEIDIVLTPAKSPSATPESMPLDDKANFTVAGITDWTAAGGHGSDTSLRASESLARDTSALKPNTSNQNVASGSLSDQEKQKLLANLKNAPGSFTANHKLGEFYLHSSHPKEALPLLEAAERANPGNYENGRDLGLAYQETGNLSSAREQLQKTLAHDDRAELHRMLGSIDEQMNAPLDAVHEYEQAASLDPSEQNYFEWGEELLLHRAVAPAIEVFTRGSHAHPESERLRAGLGAALYARGFYDDAARQLCAASDLKPEDPTPYLFLAKMDQAAPSPLPCVENAMARFAGNQPDDAQALYDYAMVLRKRQSPNDTAATAKAEALLTKAVTLRPAFAEAYLELGILDAESGKFNQAVNAYLKAIAANDGLSQAHFRLGQAYGRLDEKSKAQQEFQTYERLHQTDAAKVEQQRREIQQFVVVFKGGSATSAPPQ